MPVLYSLVMVSAPSTASGQLGERHGDAQRVRARRWRCSGGPPSLRAGGVDERQADQDDQADRGDQEDRQGPGGRADRPELDPLTAQQVAEAQLVVLRAAWRGGGARWRRRCSSGVLSGGRGRRSRRGRRRPDSSPGSAAEWYSTDSDVSDMYASSSEPCSGVSSCRTKPDAAAISPTSTAVAPCTSSRPSSAGVTVTAGPARRAARSVACGDRTRTVARVASAITVVDRAVGDDLAAADDDEVVGGHGHLAHQVRGEEDRAALGRGQVLDQVAHPEDALGVEAVDRLVEDQRLRVADAGRPRCRAAGPCRARSRRRGAWRRCRGRSSR